jgi:O-antigen/teichoic acid export membrane protein
VSVAPAVTTDEAPGATRLRLAVVDRRGAALLSAGTMASGLFAYLFNMLAARSLGPEAYGPVAVLWATLFLGAVLLFRPLEQTLSRATAHRVATGTDARAVVRAVTRLTLVVAGAAAVACAAAWRPLTDSLFAGQELFTVALIAGLAGYAGSHLVRGVMSGVRWLEGYGVLLLADGGVRMLVALPLVFLASPSLAAAAIALAAISGAVAPFLRRRPESLRRLDGEPGDSFALGAAMRFAAPAAVVAAAEQILIGGGPLLVLAVGGADATTTAGVVFAAMMLVRAPVFLFQGLAASLLPSLTAMQARGAETHLVRTTLRVAVALVAFALALASGALLAGPHAMELLYGSGFVVGRVDLALLALGVGGFLAASTFSQAALARDRAGIAACAWTGAAIVFVAAELLATGVPIHRVAVAFALASCLVAVTLLGVVLKSRR